jgi:glycosyltransferase involved in cell wall biosynthesis
MKIGIEGQRLFREKKHGMDMVALELIKNIQKIDQENEYVVFVRPDSDNNCIPEAPNFKVLELDSPGGYFGWEQFALPRAAKAEGCDILHCTSNTGPVYSSVPLVTTLHDIIYLESISLFRREGSWYQKLGNMYRRYIVPPVIRRSKRVITVSNYEKKKINQYFNLQDGRLRTIYNGVGEHFRPIEDKATLNEVRNRCGLPEQFFLFLGNTDPKKNTRGVLQAFASFNQKFPDSYYLVMLDYEEHKLTRMLELIGAPELRKMIHLTGYISNSDLPALISQSSIFLYPSLRESFGIPILEGMACGVPVISGNTSSMPEVAGEETALMVDPFEPDEISEAMIKLVQDQLLAKTLSERGIKRAKEFSWNIMAKNILKVYEEVYGEL